MQRTRTQRWPAPRLFGVGLALLGAICLAPLGAHATPQPELSDQQKEELGELFNRARVAYDAGDFGAVVIFLEEAYVMYPVRDILFRLGEAHEKLNQPEKAIEAYQRFLASSPTADERASARIRIEALEAQLARATPSPAPARLRLESDPAGALVYLGEGEGTLVGETPLELELAAGPHRIVFQRQGYLPLERAVTVEQGEARTVLYALKEALAAPLDVAPVAAASDGSALPWLAGGVGVATGVAALTLALLASDADTRVEAYDAERENAYRNGTPVPKRPADYDQLNAARHDYSLAAWIVGGVAVASLGTAAVSWLVEASDDADVGVSAGFTDHGGAVSLTIRLP